jgi:hypothetical protein
MNDNLMKLYDIQLISNDFLEKIDNQQSQKIKFFNPMLSHIEEDYESSISVNRNISPFQDEYKIDLQKVEMSDRNRIKLSSALMVP